jgi:hypothetical protein
MNKIMKYSTIQKMFETSKELIENIKDKKILIEKLKEFRDEGLEYYKKGNLDAFQFSNRLYQVAFDRAKKVGAGISNYPLTLEALIN